MNQDKKYKTKFSIHWKNAPETTSEFIWKTAIFHTRKGRSPYLSFKWGIPNVSSFCLYKTSAAYPSYFFFLTTTHLTDYYVLNKLVDGVNFLFRTSPAAFYHFESLNGNFPVLLKPPHRNTLNRHPFHFISSKMGRWPFEFSSRVHLAFFSCQSGTNVVFRDENA